MKIAIYISGITGGLLVVIRILGILLELPQNNIILILGLVLLFCIALPLIIIDRNHQNKKIEKIIDSYKGTEKTSLQLEKEESKTKGWGMNNSPLRERKSGLTWGGGNIKGANATRGSRKSFFK